jgi:hypothetical protein
MRGYVVVLERTEPGVIDFPNMPGGDGLRQLMRSQVQGYQRNTGHSVESPPSYLQEGNGPVIGFTIDVSKAKVFPTEAAAQAAIDNMPSLVRPGGLKVRPVN